MLYYMHCRYTSHVLEFLCGWCDFLEFLQVCGKIGTFFLVVNNPSEKKYN